MIKTLVFLIATTATTCQGTVTKRDTCIDFWSTYCDRVEDCGGSCTLDDIGAYCEPYKHDDPPPNQAACLHHARTMECGHITPPLARCMQDYL